MTLDPAFTYFLVGKDVAESLSLSQAELLEGMQLVVVCTDFDSNPEYWQTPGTGFPDSYPNLNPAWMFGETGVHENEFAQLEVATKYTAPDGSWADISETTGGAENNTGLFLVGVKGTAAGAMIAEAYGDGGGGGGPAALSVGYAYSPTDGGQHIYVTAYASPFLKAQVSQVLVYAAYDAPPPLPAFWTNFIGSKETP